jgi:hypothetical protein
VRNFFAALAMARKGTKKTKIVAEQVNNNKSLKRTQIYQSTKEVKEVKNTTIQ